MDEFWAWWQCEGADMVRAAIDARDPQRIVGPLGDRVRGIGPGLSWELAPGSVSEHVLVVTAVGVPEYRAAARRWLNAAPAAGAVWSYSDSRLRRPLDAYRLGVGAEDIAYSDVAVAVERVGDHLDVHVHHRSFAALTSDQQYEVAFLALDHAIGEIDVEKWLGVIEPVAVHPDDGIPLVDFVGVVDALAAEYSDGDGHPRWVTFEGITGDGRPVVVDAQVPLRSAAAPDLDTHVLLDLQVDDCDHSGLPSLAAWNALRNFREHVSIRLGSAGRVVARESCAGRHLLHVYLDSTLADPEWLRDAAGAEAMSVQHDPGWDAVAHLRR